MTHGTYDRRLAVIGFGPRGLGALEALAADAMDKGTTVKIDIFDTLDALGAGPNFSPNESVDCLLNIPVRVLDIDPPAFLTNHIAPFSDWSATDYAPDDFPPRCDLGAYLCARFQALVTATRNVFDVNHIKSKATAIKQDKSGWWIGSDETQYGPFDEVLMSPGQPASKTDPQLSRWTEHVEKHALHLTSAYPGKALLYAANDWRDKTVAIRGLGLSTHDVLRLLTVGLSGAFENGKYHRSGREPRKILPFTLDGIPPAPKPATAEVDAVFDLTQDEIKHFQRSFMTSVDQAPEAALTTICTALVAPTLRILKACESTQTRQDVDHWLSLERTHPGTQDIQDTRAALSQTVEMAHKRIPPSVGYVIGQLWRKLQNDIRHGVNRAVLATPTATALIGFDEALKRYSYGPPVEASEQLLMLIDEGLVSLQAVDDPDILLDPNGWRLVEGDDTLLATVMIDAVLPSPNLDAITDPVIQGAIKNGLMTPVKDGFGAQTRPDGSLVKRDGTDNNGLCLLGRLSLGSVIATDSLHDCFGASTDRWAAGVAQRSR